MKLIRYIYNLIYSAYYDYCDRKNWKAKMNRPIPYKVIFDPEHPDRVDNTVYIAGNNKKYANRKYTNKKIE